MDATMFVTYHEERIVGVKEFHVAVALMEGQVELLSQRVQSQWEHVYLFDLCVWFGHYDTAWALAEKGVKGCKLEEYHLHRRCHAEDRFTIGCSNCEEFYGQSEQTESGDSDSDEDMCDSEGDAPWQACQGCCFGFPDHQGIWMEDWNTHLQDAKFAAWMAAEQPLVRTILEALRSGERLPFSISEKAMANLLDIAILKGDPELAKHCAEGTELRPLRCWSLSGMFACDAGEPRCLNRGHLVSLPTQRFHLELKDPVLLKTALMAGVRLDGLTVRAVDSELLHQSRWQSYTTEAELRSKRTFFGEGIPLREALIVSTPGWAEFVSLLPEPESIRAVQDDNNHGNFFLWQTESESHAFTLQEEQLQRAQSAGLPLQEVRVCAFTYDFRFLGLSHLTLLDAAILLQDSDCAALCAAAGVKLSDIGCQTLKCELDADDHPAKWFAATAAAYAALRLAWRSEISAKGVAIYQTTRRLSHGRSFPALLVGEVIAFALEMPEMVKRLDLWEEANTWFQVGGWRKAWPMLGAAFFVMKYDYWNALPMILKDFEIWSTSQASA